MGSANPDPEALAGILRATRSVAVIGASDDPLRPSNDVFAYLARHSPYRLYPVNPNVAAVAGVPAFPALSDLPEVPDMVNVFRRRQELAGVLTETLALAPHPKYLWLQQGLWDEAVGESARAAGMTVVMDRCLKVDYARLIGS